VEVILTEEEAAIKAYLSDGEPLPPEILDNVLALYWEQEPFRYCKITSPPPASTPIYRIFTRCI